MDIKFRKGAKDKWIAVVWNNEPDESGLFDDWEFDEPYPEEVYVEINNWCIDTLGYHARTSFNVFGFKKRSDLDWFILRWQ